MQLNNIISLALLAVCNLAVAANSPAGAELPPPLPTKALASTSALPPAPEQEDLPRKIAEFLVAKETVIGSPSVVSKDGTRAHVDVTGARGLKCRVDLVLGPRTGWEASGTEWKLKDLSCNGAP